MAVRRMKHAQANAAATAPGDALDARIERELDEALKNTFPASDPITPPAERAESLSRAKPRTRRK